MAKTVAHFTLTRAGDGYLLGIEDDDGETTEYQMTFEQLDLLIEAADEQLDEDEEDLLAPDEEEDEE